MQELKYGCGIDIAKDKFDACLSVINSNQLVRICAQSSFPNTANGFAAFMLWARKHTPTDIPTVFLMEATGIYYEQLAWYLYGKDCNLSVVLPNKAKKYKDSLGLKSKTDRIDARGLAQMCCERSHAAWNPLSKSIYTLRGLTRQIESLSAQKTATANQLKAMQRGMFRDKKTEQMLAKQLDMFQKQKHELEQRVKQLIGEDPKLKRKFGQILTMKGLGLQTLAILVAETNGFAAFKNAAQLVSYAGYDVKENESGDRRGKTRISKKGNAHIRRALFFAAFNMVTYKVSGMVAFHDRIFERTRQQMKAYTAIQKKLLTIVYALWKKDQAYDPAYQHPIVKKAAREIETVPSLATAPTVEQNEGGLEVPVQPNLIKEVTPSYPDGVTQDKHPSKPRRMPSLAKVKLAT